MRELTQREIDQAPSNANFYFIDSEFGAIYSIRATSYTLPIPRKEFDISEWLHSEDANEADYLDMPLMQILDGSLCVDGNVNKKYAIAIAKHFKLTAEDLK